MNAWTGVSIIVLSAPLLLSELLPAKTGEATTQRAAEFTFFAMDTGTRDANHKTAESQVAMLKELGYAGIGPIYGNVNGLLEMLSALDKHGLKMPALYVGLNIDGGKSAVTDQLRDAIKALKGRDTLVWLYVTSKKHKASATEGDDEAVEALREVADLAQESHLRVALYPHTGFWVERVDDAVRVAEKAGRKDLGVTFNLCHWLRVDGKDLEATLKLAMGRLLVVTINGADIGGKDWGQLIQTLDRGSFDVLKLLKALKDLGYAGPVGLQGYGIKGDVRENLRRSMEAWLSFSCRLADGRIDLLADGAFESWRQERGDWKLVGQTLSDPNDPKRLAWKDGTGVAVNGDKGRTSNLMTKKDHGDVELHVEFLLPKGSNSGVYFQGRYEVQVYDSFGVQKDKYPGIECGGIYPRWIDGKEVGGNSPRVNASRPAGEWQSFDVIFRAPRFGPDGKKTANAQFVKVFHNGVLIHENVEVTGPTRAAVFPDEKPSGPLMIQGDHGPIAYRNVWLVPR